LAAELTRRKVLVVDDSDDVRALLSLALRRRGFDVAQSVGAREALEYLACHAAPDLIILDLRMPGMDGHAFLDEQERSEALRGIPVLVYSAEAALGPVVTQRAPVSSFVAKTAPISEMLDEVQRLCR
jgi:two-component system nitrogen regulation response regulator GlnG